MSDKEKPKPAWADEPTPQTDAQALDRKYFTELGSLRHATESEKTVDGDYVPVELARDLEQRLRHALKMVNSLRIDCMHGELDHEMEEQRLAAIEEVLSP